MIAPRLIVVLQSDNLRDRGVVPSGSAFAPLLAETVPSGLKSRSRCHCGAGAVHHLPIWASSRTCCPGVPSFNSAAKSTRPAKGVDSLSRARWRSTSRVERDGHQAHHSVFALVVLSVSSTPVIIIFGTFAWSPRHECWLSMQ